MLTLLHTTSPGARPLAILLVALSLSIGWGVRGNWGHEYGAMIPGVLAAVAACLVSGRADWQRRVVYFAFFGGIGWSFGGQMSYMQVIAYTHSGDLDSVAYGYANLFVIGFLWGAMGGAGTLLPVFLERERLTEFFMPLLVIFGAWAGQGVFLHLLTLDEATLSPWLGRTCAGWLAGITEEQLEWRDTDWIAALLAIGALLALAAYRRRVCRASLLMLYMAGGWWLGFTILAVGLGLRMTPPRGDSWAGALGMTAGMFAYLLQSGHRGWAWGALWVGIVGGLGFSGATLLKLIGMTSQYATNWHSVLEQTYGLINGLGVAAVLGYLAPRAPAVHDDPPCRVWTERVALAFVMLLIPWLNIRKNVAAAWLPSKVVPEALYGWPSEQWFLLGFLVLTVAFVGVQVAVARGRTIALLPNTWLGRGQWLYLVFLWWIVLWNASRTFPFHEERLITEGVIHVHACLCSALVLLLPRPGFTAAVRSAPDYRRLLRDGVIWGVAIWGGSVGLQTLITRAIYGDQFTETYFAERGHPGHGYAGYHVRFNAPEPPLAP